MLVKIFFYQENDMGMLNFWKSLAHQLIMNTYLEQELVADRAGQQSDIVLLDHISENLPRGKKLKAHIWLIHSCNTLKQGILTALKRYVDTAPAVQASISALLTLKFILWTVMMRNKTRG